MCIDAAGVHTSTARSFEYNYIWLWRGIQAFGGFLGQSPHSRKNTKEGKSLIVAQTMAVFYKHAWKLKRRREDPAEYRRLKVEAPAELSHKEEGDY